MLSSSGTNSLTCSGTFGRGALFRKTAVLQRLDAAAAGLKYGLPADLHDRRIDR